MQADCIGSHVVTRNMSGIVYILYYLSISRSSSCHLWSDFIAVEMDEFFNRVFKLGALKDYQAVYLEKEEGHETLCDIAVTYASPDWQEVRFMEGTT